MFKIGKQGKKTVVVIVVLTFTVKPRSERKTKQNKTTNRDFFTVSIDCAESKRFHFQT